MTKLMRGQIGKATGIDTTVKSSHGHYRALAPTWDMVMEYKSGRMSPTEYTSLYQQILTCVPNTVWDALVAQPDQTLLCYCRDGQFCHTHLIIDYLLAQDPERFCDARTTASRPRYQ